MVIPKDFFHRLKTKNYITNPHDNIVTGNERLLISFDGVKTLFYMVCSPLAFDLTPSSSKVQCSREKKNEQEIRCRHVKA